MSESQKKKFDDWVIKRGVWPRLTHEEIFLAGWVAATAWQPIETAPKDKYLLLCLDGRDWSIGCWNRNLYDSQSHIGDWVNDDGTESTPFMLHPTHWMELPKLPDKFKNVSCSQCGRDFGQGNHGYSHCEDHAP